MDINDFERPADRGGFREYNGGSWENFTLGDEKRARGRFSRFFLAAALYIIISNIVMIGISVLIELTPLKNNAFFESAEFLVLANVISMYLIAFPIFYLLTFKMRSATRYKSKMSVKEFAMLFLVGYALMMAGSLVGTLFSDLLGTFLGRELVDGTSELINEMPIWLTVAVPVLIGPVIEELMYRKILMDKLGTYGDRLAITVSAVAFGLFHGNIHQFFYATLLGFVLGYIYAKTSNILYPIIMHSLINFFGSVVPLPFIKYVNEYVELSEKIAAGETVDLAVFERAELISSIYSIIMFSLVAAGVFILSKYRRKFFISDRCEIEIPKKKRASVIALNVGTILFIVVTLALVVLDIAVTA